MEQIRRGDPVVARPGLMQASLEARQKHGKWDDEWLEHPLPTLNEPHKAMSWLTPDPAIDDDRKADMFLRLGLGRIDNVFLKTRRLFNALERPVGTSSGGNTVWHGYAPYDPAMLEQYVTILRAVNNFVFVGEDGRTPAMRLGFAKEPFQFEDIVWPGQRVPRPKTARRRGKRLAVSRKCEVLSHLRDTTKKRWHRSSDNEGFSEEGLPCHNAPCVSAPRRGTVL